MTYLKEIKTDVVVSMEFELENQTNFWFRRKYEFMILKVLNLMQK